MTTTEDLQDRDLEEPGSSAGPSDRAAERSAALVFAAGSALAFVFYTVVWGGQLQVGSDDLRLLSERPPTPLRAALDAFVTHWTTVPYLLERYILYPLFGFNHPVGWVAVGNAAWVSTAALVRLIIRQCGVGPWPATIAGLAVLTCADIYPQAQPHTFQVPMSVAFGLGMVALANRGNLMWSAICGLLAIMCSSAGLPFVVAGTIVVWSRRGWRSALLLSAPLGAIYGVWYLSFGPDSTGGVDFPLAFWKQPAILALNWMTTGMGAGFTALGHWRWTALLLVLVTAIGAGLAAWNWRPRRELATPLALIGAGVLHLALAYTIRYWIGAEGTKDYRYVYVTVVSLLPLMLVAMAALGRFWRPFVLLPLLLVVGAIGNLTEFPAVQAKFRAMSVVQAQAMRQLGLSPLLDKVPGWATPHPALLFRDGLNLTTVDYLRQVRDAGRLPDGIPTYEKYEHEIPVRLGLVSTGEPVPTSAECRPRFAPVTVDAPVGARIGFQAGGFTGGHPLIIVSKKGDPSSSVTFSSPEPTTYEITLPGPYVISSNDPAKPFVLCR